MSARAVFLTFSAMGLAVLGWLMVRRPEAVSAAVDTGVRAVSKGVGTVTNLVSSAPRGIRLNNPGNIEINPANRWEGEVVPSTDSRYAQFESPFYGIRALARVLETYRTRHGITTLRGVIERWAPSHQNNTEAYIRHMVQRTGLRETDDIRTNAPEFVAAIILHENGQQPYSMDLIRKAIAAARESS